MKGRGIERESERKKIERKRRFLLQFLVKYPNVDLVNRAKYSKLKKYIYDSFSVTKLQKSKGKKRQVDYKNYEAQL